MKSYINLFVLIIIILFSSCKKETLDFASDNYYDVEQFLKSTNCDTKCETAASCEGKTVKLKGKVDLDYAIKDQGEFWLNDVNSDKSQISIKLDSNIIDAVFYKLEDFKGKVIKVEGKVSGYDAPTNFTCDRLFLIKVNDEEKVSSE